MSRVIVCHLDRAEQRALNATNVDLVSCDEEASLVEQIAVYRPDAVVYELREGSDADLAVLKLLRRMAPATPLVVVGDDEGPRWETPADLRPMWYAAKPVEADALRGTLENALAHR